MFRRNYIVLICLFCLLNVKVSGQTVNQSNILKIKWVDKLKGDFSFKNQWSYPEGIYKNDFGQLVCDGFCPSELDSMIDETGKIFKDSISAYYAIVDTTHLTHTIESVAKVWEWAGTNFIEVVQKSKDTVYAYTLNNVSTHSSLELMIVGDDCKADVLLLSITGVENSVGFTTGYIIIDRKFWQKGIMKAKFEFRREDFFDSIVNKNFYWKGKIFATIKK
ncbi:hypothetical protein [Flavobacterium notoginsengisoli]|uniref:hypothetical protein n=1 Tax=Flavobacterium notoginsengisoli TaxID=1478199 RepID=UPI003645D294